MKITIVAVATLALAASATTGGGPACRPARSMPRRRAASPTSRMSGRTAPSSSARTARRTGGRALPGPIPALPSTTALKRCEDRVKQAPGCTLHVVNNYTVTGQDWRAAVPARAANAPDIGRLRPEPYWSMRGPQLATGLIVWSHGYMAGKNATESAPQSWIGRFTRLGYDLYRFDREWIADWASDATALADAVRKARAMGYRRVVLAGQSAGAWVSLAALQRGAPVDGVISIAAAHHGEVIKMRDHDAGALGVAACHRGAEARREGGVGELRRRRLRRRRPHGRCALDLRQERRRCRDHRIRRAGLTGHGAGGDDGVRPQVRSVPAIVHREWIEAGALLLIT